MSEGLVSIPGLVASASGRVTGGELGLVDGLRDGNREPVQPAQMSAHLVAVALEAQRAAVDRDLARAHPDSAGDRRGLGASPGVDHGEVVEVPLGNGEVQHRLAAMAEQGDGLRPGHRARERVDEAAAGALAD